MIFSCILLICTTMTSLATTSSIAAAHTPAELSITLERFTANNDIMDALMADGIMNGMREHDRDVELVGSADVLQAHFPKIEITDVRADGNCLYRAAARGMFDDESLHSRLRELAASMLDTEPCKETDEGAFADVWTRDDDVEDLPRRRVYGNNDPVPWRRFVDPKMWSTTEGYLFTLRTWASGSHSPEGVNLISRIRRALGVDAQSSPSHALLARQSYIRCIEGVFEEPGRRSWAEGFEVDLLQLKFNVRFATAAVFRHRAADETFTAFLHTVDRTSSAYVPLGFLGLHYVSFDQVRQMQDSRSCGDGDDNDDDSDDDSDDQADRFPETMFTPYLPQFVATVEDVRQAIRICKSTALPHVRISTSGSDRVLVECTACPLINGKFKVCIHYRFDRDAQMFRLITCTEHNCRGAGAGSRFDQRTPAELVQQLEGLDLSKGPTLAAVKAMLAGRGIVVSRAKLGRIASLAFEREYGSLEDNYSTLRDFLRHYARTAPFYWHVDADASDAFRAVFVAPSYAQRFTGSSVRLCMSDASHSAHRSGGGIWLATVVPVIGVALQKGAKSCTIVVAASFHNCTESNDAWAYHFMHIRAAKLFDGATRVLVATDGRVGVPSVVEKQETYASGLFVHVRDLIHIARNIAARKVANSTAHVVDLGWSAIYTLLQPISMAKTVREANALIQNLLQNRHSSKIALPPRQQLHTFITTRMLGIDDGDATIARGTWMMCYAKGPRFGLITTNNVESFMAAFLRIGARHVPIRAGIGMLLQWCDQQYLKVQQFLGLGAAADDTVVRAAVRHELRPMYGTSGELYVGATKHTVHVNRIAMAADNSGGNVSFSNGTTYFASITDGTCTCGWPWTMGVPCSHAVAVIRRASSNRLDKFIAFGLLYEQLKTAMSFEIKPVTVDVAYLHKDGLHKGPVLSADEARRTTAASNRGRPQSTKRKASLGEKQVQLCRTCKQPGHNSRSCPRRQPPQ